jgi:hypothetical protein
VFRIKRVEADASDDPVCILYEPAGHKLVQIVRNRANGNRFISGRLVNFQSSSKNGTKGCLRLRIGTGELQTKLRELASYFPEQPGARSEATD